MSKKFTYVLGIITFALTTTCCGYNRNSKVTLKSISLSCTPFKSYVIGDHLLDEATTKIELVGNYSNGISTPLSFSDVSLKLTSDKEEYDPFSPLSAGGSYSLKASMSGVISNTFSFSVASTHTYVSSITYGGPDNIGINRPQQFTLTVNPSNHTEQVLFTSSNETVASISQINLNTFEVVGLQKGTSTISFSAQRSEIEGDNVVINCDLTVDDNYVTDYLVAGPDTLGINSTIQIQLDVEPRDFTVEINAESANPLVASVTKVDEATFNITGVTSGEVDINFSAPNSESTTIEKSFHINVQNVVATNIEQTYNEFNKKNIYSISGCPTTGNSKLLLIPIWFNDSASFINEANKETVRADIESAFFGDIEEVGWHSVSSFYNEESKQRLNLNGTVSEWYEPNRNAAYYSSEADSQIAIDAVNWYFVNHSSDSRINYDSDGDGYLDGVVLIYAAPDYVTYKKLKKPGYGKDKENLWAYVSYVTSFPPSVINPVVSAYMWASYDFMYSETTAKARTGYKFGYGDTSHANIDAHTYIHEMGHIFGLEDYYDYAGITSYAGRYSMQDYNVCGHDGFSTLALGWANPYIPTSSCEIILNDFQSSHELILLTPQWNIYNSAFDEYLLLELYTPTGLNNQDVTYNYHSTGKAPNAVGVKLWHVDAKLFKASGNSGVFTSNVNVNKINTAFNNTSKTKAEGGRDCYAKPVSTYQEYSLLHLIRNNVLEDYHSNNPFKAADLFYADSTFTMSTYQSQFIKGTKLDFNQNLGWSFTVHEIHDYGTGQYSARITLTKTL